MSSSTVSVDAFAHARQLHAQGQQEEAEQALKELTTNAEHREKALRALVELYMQAGRLQDTINAMLSLTEAFPDRLYYCARLAALLEGRGQLDQAIGQYLRLLQHAPQLAEAHFNLALLYRKSRRYAEALASYENALKYGIDGAEEVYSNMGVLYSELRRKDQARQMYERALQARPDYVPVLFNLAGLLEESGERQQATSLYERVLSIAPGHWESLARLVHARTLGNMDAPLIDAVRRAVDSAGEDSVAREGLGIALGKALDDLGQYEQALAAYRAANAVGRLRNPPYDRQGVERGFDRVIELFSREWLQGATCSSTASPIFICGMFRSGSTLIEQILAAHPAVTAGGELDFLAWLVEQRLGPYPERAHSASRAELEEIGNNYLAMLRILFPAADRVTDKRPDNFLILGLIRALFPAAKIIYTKRNPADNCLSVYFQHLGATLNYATDIENSAHYYRQHERLMQHWTRCFPDNICTVDYDELVTSPEPVVRRLLNFLGLGWDERCLSFEQSANLVKSASVWQVREGFYDRSKGRWKNYAPFLPGWFTDLGKGVT